MRYTIFTLLFCVGMLVGENSVSAAEWMFERSYFSHALPPEVQAQYPQPVSRSAYRQAARGTTPGFAVRGVSRWKWTTMRSGQSTDTTLYRQDFVERHP
ncbi:hypothetical protein MNBD_PLANCTO02-726 [hydrothermal vent metagenome]|uniref:Uncharacterized protein n=1 Tax=hydrothermal vent metagenome TaxID=652676 RepID=A0A3B1DFP1_9ZZZZ